MNILHIASYYPSEKTMHAGGLAMGKEISTLKKLGHTVYTVSFVQKEYDFDIYQEDMDERHRCVILDKKRKILNIIRHPFSPIEFATRFDNEFLAIIESMISEYRIDAIHAEYSAMLWYTRIIKKHTDLKYVIVLHDVAVQSYIRKAKNEKNILKKFLLTIEKNKIASFEKRMLKKCDEIISFSKKDNSLIKEEYGLESKYINTYFGLDKMEEKKEKYKRKNDDNFSVCFMGQMGRKENNDAAIRLVSIFNKLQIDNKKLHVVGANPSDYLLRLEDEKIIITGFVDDIDKYVIENCDVACFPLETGAGIKIKVLEALAIGIPVLTNIIGAEGIDEKFDYIIQANSDEEYVEQLEHVYRFNDKVDFTEFLREFDWSRNEAVFKELYGDV